MDNQELALRRKATSDHTDEETTWGGPAGDILTGIRNTEKAPAERAIWELVQNARDVSWEDEPAVISFERDTEGLVFSHYGKPFSDVSLGSLIKQTSSKVRADIKIVGKYGTGFITTHRFGRLIDLSGLLQVVSDEDLYYPFSLLIDRSSDDKAALMHSLQEQYNKVKGWGYDASRLITDPHGKTSFRYISKTEAEKEALKTAFEKAPALAPYVLVLNQKYVKEIGFHDRLSGLDKVYRLMGLIDHQIIEGELYSLRKTEVTVEQNGLCASPMSIYYLVSKETDERIEEGVVTVILPIKDDGEGCFNGFLFDSQITNLFLSLPLIGTENWGVNYLLHSPLFECENDSRSGLRIIPQGMGLSENDNQSVLDLAYSMIQGWLSDSLHQIANRKCIGRVNFSNNSKQPFVTEYFEKLQRKWSGYFMNLEIALNNELRYIKPSSLYVLNSMLCTVAKTDDSFKEAMYAVLCARYKGFVPCKEDFLYWCDCVNDWRRPNGELHILGVEEVVETINALKLSENGTPLSEEWIPKLKIIVRYLIESGNERLLSCPIIPNEHGVLKSIDILKKPVINSVELRSVLDEIAPEESKSFIHSEFRDLKITGLQEYTEGSVKDALTKRIGELQRSVEAKLRAIKSDVNDGCFDRKDTKWVDVIEDKVLLAILRLYTMRIDRRADNQEAKLCGLFAECLGVTEYTDAVVSKEIFTDCEQMWRTILFEIVYRFERLSDEEQRERKDWLIKLVALLKTYSSTVEYLERFMVYPDQDGELHFASSLISGIGIDNDLKDFYDEIVLKEGKSIRSILVDDEFAPYMPQPEMWDNQTIARKIEDEVCGIEGYPDISDYSKKAAVLQIVRRLESGQQWALYFRQFSAQKTAILASVTKSENVFKLLLQPKERLEQMSKLAANEHCDQILCYAKTELERQMFNEADMQYKRGLGLYVESYLLKQLQGILGENETIKALPADESVEGKDVQGGQDVIVYYKKNDVSTPIYYLEIKSRWSTKESVEMTITQLAVSAREKDNYALCVVDMHDYNRENVLRNEYPKEFGEIKDRISVVRCIGNKNERLVPFVTESKTEVHLGGDIRSIVPQMFIADNRISFDELVGIIEDRVRAFVG